MSPTVFEPDEVHDGSGRVVRFGGSRGYLLALPLRHIETQVYSLLILCMREGGRCFSETV